MSEGIGLEAIHAHETRLVRETATRSPRSTACACSGPDDSAGSSAFAVEGVHPHDVGTILDESRVAIRAGHHCAQPLMEHLGLDATARASFGVYNGKQDVRGACPRHRTGDENLRMNRNARSRSTK
jgi:cysteine desulfurase/selenocysteine lyase